MMSPPVGCAAERKLLPALTLSTETRLSCRLVIWARQEIRAIWKVFIPANNSRYNDNTDVPLNNSDSEAFLELQEFLGNLNLFWYNFMSDNNKKCKKAFKKQTIYIIRYRRNFRKLTCLLEGILLVAWKYGINHLLNSTQVKPWSWETFILHYLRLVL